MSTFLFDLQLAARLLARAPAYTATAVATLAVGIAGVTLMWVMANDVLLRELPFPEANRLVLVGDSDRGSEAGNSGYATFAEWHERSSSFEMLAIVRSWTPTLFDVDEAVRLTGVRLTAEGLPALGAEAALGRLFDESDDHPDRRRVVVISHALWRDRFDADPEIVGKALDMAGTEYQVIGVLNQDFEPVVSRHLYSEADLYAPLGYRSEFDWACHSCRHLKVFGRLAEGVTVEQAHADLAAIQTDLFDRFPDDFSHPDVAVLPFRAALMNSPRPVVVALLAAVAMVLLIACANVASLQLARAARRRRELELRAALGASRSRVIRQVITESTLLWLFGAALGVGLSVVLLPLVERLSPANLVPIAGLNLDPATLAGALLITLAASLSFSLAPALGVSRRAMAVNAGGRWSTNSSTVGRKVLVVSNVAMAFALVVGAGLMLESVGRLLSASPGFEAEDVSVASLSILGERYNEDDAALAAIDQIVERVETLPGVKAAAIGNQIPFGGNFDGRGVDVEGRVTGNAEDEVDLQRYSVTQDYLQVMGIPLLRGRWFESQDVSSGPKVVLVSESAAGEVAPTGDVLGKRIRFGGRDEWFTVVGVVGDVRHEELGGRILPSVYQTQRQWTDRYVTLAVRTEAKSADEISQAGLQASIRAAVTEVAPGVPVYAAARLESLAADTASRQRFTSSVLAAFSLIALFLAAVGLYGVVAFLVEQQSKEIGVRVALGAMRSQITGWVFGQGVLVVGLGLLFGIALAVGTSRLLSSLVYEVDLHEPAVYLQTLIIVTLIAVLAHAGPLVRALRVDPMSVLRRD